MDVLHPHTWASGKHSRWRHSNNYYLYRTVSEHLSQVASCYQPCSFPLIEGTLRVSLCQIRLYLYICLLLLLDTARPSAQDAAAVHMPRAS